MNRKLWRMFVGLCTLALAAFAAPAQAQMSESKEKPPMYSYVAFWDIPRPQWGDMEKNNAAHQKIESQALASGTLVGYGDDQNLVHSVDGPSHDNWWSGTSMAAVLSMLDQFYKAGTPTTPVLAGSSKHWDAVYVSRTYNWHSGTVKDGYTHGSSYKLKPTAPDDALETLSKNLFVPLFEKLLADGTIQEYEVDVEAIHTDDPNTFWIFYLTQNAEGLDKVNAALRATLKEHPLQGPAFDLMVDYTPHRDYLARTTATYK